MSTVVVSICAFAAGAGLGILAMLSPLRRANDRLLKALQQNERLLWEMPFGSYHEHEEVGISIRPQKEER